eukprot:TRINITY_DN3303_c0_g1_i1.p1 TRINITY_DN3303_c0_g1~~TRINITY_DN3303_c0_g1_i1.p1  ORF type:complete len:281 (-),score=29.91 TRINITY_DN3303_c0_g1_i1:70-912(-)
MATISEGDRVFFLHPEESWLLGRATGKADAKGSVSYSCVTTDEDGKDIIATSAGGSGSTDPAFPAVAMSSVSGDNVDTLVEASLRPVDDLITMPYLHNSVLMHHVRRAYWQDRVYSRIGPIVLALNPYNFQIPHYADSNMSKYIAEGPTALTEPSRNPTHPWTVAHRAYWLMRTDRRPQSVLISGESGAGKTEACKMAARYLADVSTASASATEAARAQSVATRLISSSPVMEAFGNAKTVRCVCASRLHGDTARQKGSDAYNSPPDGRLDGDHMRADVW